MAQQTFQLGSLALTSRMLLGTALYPSPEVLKQAVKASGAEIVTVSLRRESARERAGHKFWQLIHELGVHVLPNTAGCRNVQEAVTTAHMAREVFETNRIKLEVIGDDYTLQPDPLLLVEAAQTLTDQGFEVWPYTTDDLVICKKLLDAGCPLLMPWGAPIGSGRGLNNPYALRTLRERFPDVPLIVDAGIGRPSHAVEAMEMGYDGILLNTAVAKAADPVRMAESFSTAIISGRQAFEAGPMESRDMASPSTPLTDVPFWHEN